MNKEEQILSDAYDRGKLKLEDPSDETCDGQDEDCDGEVDEGADPDTCDRCARGGGCLVVASGQIHVYAVDGDAPELLYQGGPGGGGVDVGPDGLIYVGAGDVTRINPATEEVSLFSD